MRMKNANKVIISNLNINSIRNKIERLKETVLKYMNILQLDSSEFKNDLKYVLAKENIDSCTKFLITAIFKSFK